jgi:hypothetical protein
MNDVEKLKDELYLEVVKKATCKNLKKKFSLDKIEVMAPPAGTLLDKILMTRTSVPLTNATHVTENYGFLSGEVTTYQQPSAYSNMTNRKTRSLPHEIFKEVIEESRL